MSDSDDKTKGIEPLDLRMMTVFAAITLALVLPAIVNALTPADEQSIRDAADALAMRGRQALAIADARPRLTPLLYKAELEDVAADAVATGHQLEREAIVPSASVDRATVVRAAAELAGAVDDASLAVDDDAMRTLDRARIAAAVARLAGMGSGG